MKWNQCTGVWKKTKVPWLHIHLYASVLNWNNVWWLNYMFMCNHFGWNETNVLEIERKSRYHGYICLYMLIELIWCVMTELYVHINHFGWRIERKSRYHGYICIYMLQTNWIDMICHMSEWGVHMQFIWLKWNQSTVDWIKNQDTRITYEFMCGTTEMKSVWVKWSMYEWNELKKFVIVNRSMCDLYEWYFWY